MAKDKDIEIIREALETWRCLMATAKVDYTPTGPCGEALEALVRIEHRLGPRQLGLLEANDEG